MSGGVWMPTREDPDAAAAAVAASSWSRARGRRAPRSPPEKPRAGPEQRAQRWRLSPASLLFLGLLLADPLRLCPAADAAEDNRRNPHAAATASSSSWEPEGPEQPPWVGGNRSLPGTPSPSPGPREPPRCPEAPAAPALDLEAVCRARELLQGPRASSSSSPSAWPAPPVLAEHFGAFRLPFCRSYSLWDLLLGMGSPESLDCSLARLRADWAARHGEACGACLEAYQRLDQHAQEKYAEFDLLLGKYLQAEDYSVRSCLGDCKAVYKAWLCSEYFNVTQLQCPRRIPCKQYCLEVQTKCPFVLPDNDELIYGGLPGFICTGLLESQLPGQEAKCCDLQWDSCSHQPERSYNASSTDSEPFHSGQDTSHRPYQQQQQHYHLYYHPHRQHHPHPHPSLLPVSAGSRLSHSKIRLCVLVLMLLHTMASFSSVHGGSGGSGGSAAGGGLSLEALPAMEESRAREE